MSAGRRRVDKVAVDKAATGSSPLLAAPPLAGAVVAAAAWVALVVWAVRLSQASSWVLAGVVTAVAVACLLVVFAMLGRAWAALNGRAAPPRTRGRRRR